MTVENIKKYLPASVATAKGHLDQQRKNLETTKFNITENSDADYALENLPSNSRRTNAVFAAIVTYETTNGTICADLTGRFPVTSGRGNKYVFVLYDYDYNAILVDPMKSRTGTEII